MICTFCFKSVNYTCENESKERLLFKRFIDLVQRYFKRNFKSKPGDLNGLESCQDCNFLIKTFCDFYNELRFLELQLERKVRKMLEVVTAAEKVPSRIKLAKEKLENREQDGDESLYEVISKFRKDFKRKCTRHLSTCLPRVMVKRIEIENNDKKLIKPDKIILKTDGNGSFNPVANDNLFLGWISTLVGVLWLEWSCWTQTPAPTLTTTSFFCDEPEDHSIYREDDVVSSTATSCNSIPQQEESFRTGSPLNSQGVMLKHEENPETVSAVHRITSSDTCPSSSSKDNLTLADAHVHVELKEETRMMINPHPTESVAVALVLKASALSTKRRNQFICDLCQKVLQTKESLMRHKNTVHVSRDQWLYPCSICNRRFAESSNLRRHVKSIEHQFRKSLSKVRRPKRNSPSSRKTKALVVKIEVVDSQNRNETMSELLSETGEPNILEGEAPDSDEQVTPNSHESKELGIGNCESPPQATETSPNGGKEPESNAESVLDVGLLRPKRHQKRKYYADEETGSLSESTTTTGSNNDYSDNDDFYEIDSDANESTTTSCSSSEDQDFENRSPQSKKVKVNLQLPSKRAVLIHPCNIGGCKDRFRSQEELDIHKKLHGEFSCNYCDHKESYAPDLTIHETTHAKSNGTVVDDKTTTTSRFQCARCKYWCSNKARYIEHHLRRHLRLSRRTKTCPVCKTFLSLRGLERHLASHHQIEGVDEASIQKCDQCSAYFLKEFQLFNHKAEAHTDFPIPCDSTDNLKPNAYEHVELKKETRMMINPHPAESVAVALVPKASENKFICDLCGKVLKSEKSLKRHNVWVHVSRDQWRYPCSVCNRRFFDSHNLKRHCKTIEHQFRKSLSKVRRPKTNSRESRKSKTVIVKIEVVDNQNQNEKMSDILSETGVANIPLDSDEQVPQNSHESEEFGIGNCESSPQVIETSPNDGKETRPVVEPALNVGLLRPKRHQKRKYFAEEETGRLSESNHGDSDNDDLYEIDSDANKSTSTSGSWSVNPDFKNQCPQSKKLKVNPPRPPKRTVLIHPCNIGGCKECFRSQEELDIHKKLHGEFLCKYCDRVEAYAPDLALHETTHSKRDGSFGTDVDNNTTPRFQCPRCEYWCTNKARYIEHHLRQHLRLSRRTHTCSVCNTLLSLRQRERHLATHHQLEGVDEASIQKCDQCSAYFLKELQLLKHKAEAHTDFPMSCDSDISSDSSTSSDSDTLDCDVTFNCVICNKTFANDTFLKRHEQKVHGPARPVKLEQSTTTKRRRRKKKRLIVSRTKVKKTRKIVNKFRCDFGKCILRFPFPEELEQHKLQHGTFPCSLCDFVETYAPKLALHELTHEAPLLAVTERKTPTRRKGITKKNSSVRKSFPVLNCVRCTFSTSNKNSYIKHHLELHLGVPYKIVSCPICKRKTTGSSSLQSHTKYSHNIEGMAPEEVPRCDKCPAYFRRYIQLASHKAKIHGDDPLKCLDCGKRFKGRYCLTDHRIRKHKKNVADFQFPCDEEGCKGERRFETKIHLEWHKIATHSGTFDNQALICSKCGVKLLTVMALKNHMRLHDENREERIKIRRSEKNFVCDECGKAFKNNHALAFHKLVHIGPSSWKYSCPICEKRCISEEKLYEHLRTHTNEKPFICQFCGEEYAHGHNLRNHMNKQHGANVVARKYDTANLESRKGKKLGRGFGFIDK